MNKFLTVTVLMALLCYGVESFRVTRREAPTPESTVVDRLSSTLWGYWDYTTSLASNWVNKAKELDLQEKAKSIYDETASAVGTYAGVLHDQVYYYIYPQQ
ncbi:apolipoprotein C-II [Amia ocellicauda]|uniref:apolipoprotein C-II n=1 Tax=Amia ocellicauda TaxID=2972642 RepID=UPI003464907D